LLWSLAQLAGRDLIDFQRLRVEDHAVALRRGGERNIALAHILGHALGITLVRRAEAAAAAGAHGYRIAGIEPLHQHLGVRQIAKLVASHAQRDLVARARTAAREPPRPAVHAIDLHVEVDVRARLHHLLRAEAAAVAPGTARIVAQRMPLEEQRILRLHLLD